MGPKTLNLSQKNSDFDENANKTQTNEDLNRLRLISSSDHGNHISPLSEHETTVFSRVSAVRGQCLIIQGLPESTASASKERVSADLQLFQCLLNELLRPNEEVSVLKAFRLGKRSIDISEHSRPRPLKIVLSNQEQNKVAEWRDGSRDLQRPDSAAPSPNPLDRTDPDEGTIGSLNGISNGTIIKRSKSLKLTFYYTNVQSILPKLDELKIHICDLSPDVVSLTESWLSENVDDRELMLPGFQLFRRDRRERQGGGVVTYVKHGLLVSEKTEQFACSAETIWLTIRVPGSQSLEVLTVYRPPRSDPEADARLLEELGRFALRPDVLIMGDFNAPLIDWSSLHARGPELAFDRRFLDMALRSFLTQHVLFPTRVREGQQSNCLDLVLTKSMDSIDEVQCLPPLGRSDHVVLQWDYSIFSVPEQPPKSRRNIWRGNFEQMKAEINNANWESAFSGNIMEDWKWFSELLHALLTNHCPLSRKGLNNRPRWLTQALKKEVNKKRRLWQKSLTDGTPVSKNAYKTQRNLVKRLTLRTRQNFEKDLLNRAMVNPKLFYSYVRSSTRNRDPIPFLKTSGDVEISEDGEKAEHFSQFFKSIFTSESLFTPPDYDFDEGPKIESVSFDEATVRKELMTLNESKSPGPDDIPPKLLKELAAELAKPLSMLFQASFEAGCLPADWKSARITPLHKGGSKASANNYRPISLTSICCKLMEKIIKRELMRFLEQHNLLSDAQHGFRSGRSCVTNLLNCLERWTRSVDEGNALHVVYIDFKKAFDSVPHQRLLHKLSRIGVRGNLLKWIQSFLLDRCQTVHVGGQQSTEVAVESGVPQGSVLGPTLFIIYVNDCVSELDCGVGMFADDIKLWSVIRTADDEEHLQANLNRLQQWSKDWLLPFNEKKCNILRVGRARSPNHMAYCLNGIPLQEVDSQKDLGVWITTSLKPSLHCTKIAKSAMSVLYLVKRTFSAFDEDCFAKVFRTFVRPQLEFAIQAWRPWTAKDISILERVQRRATKLVAGQGSLPYATRLANLDLFPLSYRQLRGDLIQAFRIIRGQDCSLVPGDFFELATTTNLRGHQFKLRVTGARLDTRKFFFSNRVIEAWNALPVDVVMSASVEVFKRKLDLCSRVH
ncbi:hypothetical protein SprV_0702457400 [Sparganum proliferum]